MIAVHGPAPVGEVLKSSVVVPLRFSVLAVRAPTVVGSKKRFEPVLEPKVAVPTEASPPRAALSATVMLEAARLAGMLSRPAEAVTPPVKPLPLPLRVVVPVPSFTIDAEVPLLPRAGVTFWKPLVEKRGRFKLETYLKD